MLSPLMLVAACGHNSFNPVSQRVTGPADIPVQESVIFVPITASLSQLQAVADKEVPTTLATIDEEKRAGVRVNVDYVWTRKPGVDVHRITFANETDPVLARLIARLEADMPRITP